MDGNNYLIPVDAKLERDVDVEDESLSLERMLKVVEPARQLRLVILDACRDNPFGKAMKRSIVSRAIGRGLSRIEPDTSNTLIAFSAKAGSTAADGDGARRPFTALLLKHLAEPGVDLRIAFGRIRDEVYNDTQHRHEPFLYGSVRGSLVSLVADAKPSEQQAPVEAAVTASMAGDPNAVARIDYELAERVDALEAWDAFVATHPTGFYGGDITRKRKPLRQRGHSAGGVHRRAEGGHARLHCELRSHEIASNNNCLSAALTFS